jgi:2,3-bisphosphoglycerate-independent phosphoglycerate mutase
MSKKTDSSDQASVKNRRKGPPWVVRSDGGRQRFLRGMITHDLVQRGITFDDAYAIARSIRAELEDREEISTAEIRDLIREHLEGRFGEDSKTILSEPLKPAAVQQVIYHGQLQPFSRGLLARSIYAAGISLDRAYRLVTALERELRDAGITVIPSHEVARRVGDLLERDEGIESARRYRLVRRIHRLPRPLIIYIGGASGTGKSTLALELAPLLRIYRINATDTIRQVMRMVFSPAILPALHSSTFEVLTPHPHGITEPLGDFPRNPDVSRRLIATFEEQAIRVCVGVRAVVERAIAENMSIVVEGVHLYPPLVPFADLEGAAYQVPLMLGILDEEVHRGRFLLRSRSGGRLAERYVESFGSIRSIQDFLLQQAETYDVPLLDNSYGEAPVVRTLRLVTGMLQQKLPSLAKTESTENGVITPTLVLAIDSLADRPIKALGKRTPLEVAKTPHLDRLAREGQSGLCDPVAPGIVSDMASGSLALFGHSPMSMKRGPIEAMGAGIELSAGDVALRANLATIDEDGLVVDRRAGRLGVEVDELADALDRLSLPDIPVHDVEVRVRPASEHRLAVVLRGEGLSSEIRGSDPGDSKKPLALLTPEARNPDDPRAVYTAKVLATFEREAHRILEAHPINRDRLKEGALPINAVLTRGAGRAHRLLPLEHAGIPLRLTCISGSRTMLALAAWLGAETITKSAMTGDLESNLAAKFRAASEAMKRSDLVVVHFRGADVAAREGQPDLKVVFLEKLDREIGKFLDANKEPLRIVVASDHATLSESGENVADPLPVLIWGEGIEADDVTEFSENAATSGALQRFPLQLLLSKLFELS